MDQGTRSKKLEIAKLYLLGIQQDWVSATDKDVDHGCFAPNGVERTMEGTEGGHKS
jgi:hypothetical protein